MRWSPTVTSVFSRKSDSTVVRTQKDQNSRERDYKSVISIKNEFSALIFRASRPALALPSQDRSLFRIDRTGDLLFRPADPHSLSAAILSPHPPPSLPSVFIHPPPPSHPEFDMSKFFARHPEMTPNLAAERNFWKFQRMYPDQRLWLADGSCVL
jgi:hypothetical protein